ncbi:MAG: hypothetical protein IH612_17155 [Desulfofustis sp.]|nr:hypothetical protein [Desulfofustis sp.]
MNLFFYSSRRTDCPDGCSYPECAERCLWTLRSRPALSAVERLPYGTLFPLPQRAPLRSGDLIIIHIANLRELEDLLDHGQALAHYRLVLIVSDQVYDCSRRYHLLNPRYIATTRQHVNDLEIVVNRITQQVDVEQEPARAVSH